jgi:hypothetical protein
MWRWALFFAAFTSLPALAADSLHVISLLPDGNGGIHAFVRDSKKVFAVPVDPSGASHPEHLVTVRADLPLSGAFGIGRTTAGYVMTFNDPTLIAWLLPLRSDFSSDALLRSLGRDTPFPLVCNDDLCAVIRQENRTLLLVDDEATPRAELPMSRDVAGIVGTSDGGFAVLKSQIPAPNTAQLVVEFINRAGQVSATSTVTTSDRYFLSVAIAPHPRGVAVFWNNGTPEVNAAIVLSDGTVDKQTVFVAPDLESYIHVAAGGGRYALALTTVVQIGVHAPSPINTPDIDAAYAMLLSESLDILAGPTKLAPEAATSASENIVASGDAFFAVFTTPLERILRIPFTGPIEASSSKPLDLAPLARRRSVTR